MVWRRRFFFFFWLEGDGLLGLRDCALRVRVCDEAVSSSSVEIYLSVYLSVWTGEWMVGCTCIQKKVTVWPQQFSRKQRGLKGERGLGGSEMREG